MKHLTKYENLDLWRYIYVAEISSFYCRIKKRFTKEMKLGNLNTDIN
jgi:hypothetical protein